MKVKIVTVAAIISTLVAISCALSADTDKPLIIADQGGFAVGGTVIVNPGEFDYKTLGSEGQTLHGDHASVFYQIPVDARQFPIAFLHGAGQSARTWQTTPDGREGFQNLFLRRGYGVYLIDQPRRGQAGQSTVPGNISAAANDQLWYSVFRIGQWPDYYPGVQFPKDKESLNQFFRQMTPNTGAYDQKIIADTVGSLFKKIGPGVLVTHSQGGGPGWYAAIRNPAIKAVVSYEPGLFVFPEGETPPPIPGSSPFDPLKAEAIPMAEFTKLTQIPIVLYYGDNIPDTPSDLPGKDNWRTRLQMARRWTETVNRHGGDVTLVHLPAIGITGNTHFPFSDLNNTVIADLLEAWLKEKDLD